MKPELGKSYKVKIGSEYDGKREHNIPVYAWGKCVYIHPQNRFCVLQFENYRESFDFGQLMTR